MGEGGGREELPAMGIERRFYRCEIGTGNRGARSRKGFEGVGRGERRERVRERE